MNGKFEATIRYTAKVEDCHQIAALDKDNQWINFCVTDVAGLVLVAYAQDEDDLIGRRVSFTLTDGQVTDFQTVEGYSVDVVTAIVKRQSLILSPLDEDKGSVSYGVHRRYHDDLRQSDRSHKTGRLALASSDNQTIYLVIDLGHMEAAIPIWFGHPPPCGVHPLDDDQKILAFVQRCNELGNIQRRHKS